MTFGAIKRVAVIGAGASGIIAAKAFLEEKSFTEIKVFERNGYVGGLWNYSSDVDAEIQVPSTNPHKSFQPSLKDHEEKPFWPSPAYDSLITNVPGYLMMYTPLSPKEDRPFFIHRSDVVDYIVSYAKDIEDLIEFNTNVVDVHKRDGEWVVSFQKYEGTAPGPIETETFDAIAVAPGYFNIPFTPEVKGMKEFNTQFPGRITHAKTFRRADEFKDKIVLVVGNAASGTDIANQLVHVTGKKVYKSARSESTAPGRPYGEIIDVGVIEEFRPDGSILVAGGTVLDDVDAVIYATGYLRSLPFMSDLNKTDKPLITNGIYVHHLYLHFIYIPDPTIVILGTPRFVLPFRVSQAQACYIARVWSGRLKLPPTPIMENFVSRRFKAVGDSYQFHDLAAPLEDADFCDWISELCRLAPGDYGMFPRPWPIEEREARKNIGKLRIAFAEYYDEHGVYPSSIEQIRLALKDELEPVDTDPNFESFGKVIRGDEYSQEDILQAEQELAETNASSGNKFD
ncbi:uncharacterized protein V1516DRAFT_435993 [Lipomyces oligophaga]|uniref:uncharacterized protein n=1 Tax=Lipomyces oligophaga TaxID=45792 RepID=UPI0034CE51F6